MVHQAAEGFRAPFLIVNPKAYLGGADTVRLAKLTDELAGEFDVDSPITNAYLSAACGNSLPGWPCDKELDELRTAWLRELDPGKRRGLLDAFQKRAFEAVPYISVGQYWAAFAARKDLRNLDRMKRGLPTVWMLDR